MKPVKMSTIGAVLVLMVFSAAFVTRSTVAKKQDHTTNGNGFAVLELFTSEGCSSCPPADELLARIQKEAGNKSIYILAYHVDYWNRLGWKDVFSDPQFTKRQYRYNQQFTSQVYTPQLIINGKGECVGSDESAVNNFIKDALNGNAAIAINIKAQVQSGKLNVDYQVTGNAANNQLLIAAVQKHAVSKVERGENKGRTLSHVQIVRNLYTFEIRSGNHGSEQIKLPVGFNAREWEFIGMIQNQETGVMVAATRVSVN